MFRGVAKWLMCSEWLVTVSINYSIYYLVAIYSEVNYMKHFNLNRKT